MSESKLKQSSQNVTAEPTKSAFYIKTHKSRSKFWAIIIAGIVILIALAVVGIQKKHQKHTLTPSERVAQSQQAYSVSVNQALKNKQYENYQNLMLSYIDAYIYIKNYSAASNALSEIQSKVPQSQWSINTYQDLSQVALHNGDKPKYREYTQTMIEKMRAIGDNQEANYYSKQLQNNQ